VYISCFLFSGVSRKNSLEVEDSAAGIKDYRQYADTYDTLALLPQVS
jgi:hypothetical protein